jgi:hypothetical protein
MSFKSSIISLPFSLFLPIKKTLGALTYFANCLRVARPMPDVAPAKTATIPGARDCNDWFDRRIALRLTIVAYVRELILMKTGGGNERGRLNVKQSYHLIHAAVTCWGRVGAAMLHDVASKGVHRANVGVHIGTIHNTSHYL